jgi:fumarate reductase (CoM/CoB) subunit B
MTAAHLVQTGARPMDSETSAAVHACSGCMRCSAVCKHETQVADALGAARGEAVRTGTQPRGAATTLATFVQSGNPFGQELSPRVDRFRVEAPMRHALFPGCSTLVKRPELIDDTLAVALAFGAPMGVARGATQCCGYPLYASGDRERFAAHAQSVAQALSPWPELVVLDPGCAYTLKVLYPRAGVAMPGRILTVVEVLAENLPHAPQLPQLPLTVGYHDACHLGRGLEQYEEPRALLRRAVAQLLEAPSHHAQAGCAGGGGLLPRTMPEVAVEVARRQANEVGPGGEAVVSACPTSARMFARSGRTAYDLLAMLRRWTDQAADTSATDTR